MKDEVDFLTHMIMEAQCRKRTTLPKSVCEKRSPFVTSLVFNCAEGASYALSRRTLICACAGLGPVLPEAEIFGEDANFVAFSSCRGFQKSRMPKGFMPRGSMAKPAEQMRSCFHAKAPV